MKRLAVIMPFLIMLLTACLSPIGDASLGKPLASQNGIEIYQASVRLLSGDLPAAAYMFIRNTGAADDRLVNVQTDFAEEFMLHQSIVDSNGVASMNMLRAIDIPAGQTVELKPGGFQIIFLGLKPGIKAGDTVTLLLQFEQAGTISVPAQFTGQ